MNLVRIFRFSIIKLKRFYRRSKAQEDRTNSESGEGATPDNKEAVSIIRDAIGIVGGSILAGLFLGTDHKICGLWASFIVLAAAFHIPFHYWARKKGQKCKAWCCYGVLIFFIAVWFLFWTHTIIKQESTPSTDESGNPIGLLLPANDPVPLTIPVAPIENMPKWLADFQSNNPLPLTLTLPKSAEHDLFIIMGGNFIGLGNRNTISLIRFHDKNMVTLSIDKMGASVSGEFFASGQNALAVISNNEFVLDRQNFWRMSRPDKSTLIITSHQNVEVLNIRFCRTNFLKFLVCLSSSMERMP